MGGGGSVGGCGSPTTRNQNGGSRSISRSALGKRSHTAAERTDSKKALSSSGGSIKKNKSTDSLAQSEQPNGSHHHHLTSPPRGGAPVASEAENHSKSNGEAVEMPRIYIGLSRKEKEDDFLTMKGTKLPHRPKKRPKAIDKTLQYCFPGMFLSDLSKSRYEVREKKSAKKPKRRGLKGLENMDSDSD